MVARRTKPLAGRGTVALAAMLLWIATGCVRGERCTPGTSRTCTNALEGGVAQNGYEACAADHTWSECVSVGACTLPNGLPLPVYARCTSDTQCGPTSCATCNHYTGVENPNAYSLCDIFCQSDSDCVPTTASADVTPTCVLGQCTVLCHTASSTCPQDTQCLPWNDPRYAMTYPGYDGLCE